MKSLLYQGVTPFVEPPGCSALLCRSEVPIVVRKGERLYRFTLRDKVVPEDSYLVMVKAAAFALRQGEAYAGRAPDRAVKDFLIKDNTVI